MLLLRLFILLVFCYFAFAALKSMIGPGRKGSRKVDGGPRGEDMVLDPQCQSYISVADAVAQSGRYFCSRECARLYLNR